MSEFRWVHIENRDQLEAFYRSILPKIKEVAKSHGYAIGVHGSLRRDLDLIAVPWIDNYSDKEVLIREIHKAACGLEQDKYQWEKKPHGRVATSFPVCWIDFDYDVPNLGHIDLSVVEWSK